MAECSMLTARNDMEHTSDTSVWFRSSWNYTLRAEPTLSESELELSVGPAKARVAWGVSVLGHTAKQRDREGTRQIPSWKSGTESFCLSRHMWAFVSWFIHSFSTVVH